MKQPPLANAELAVMELPWEKELLTAREIRNDCCSDWRASSAETTLPGPWELWCGEPHLRRDRIDLVDQLSGQDVGGRVVDDSAGDAMVFRNGQLAHFGDSLLEGGAERNKKYPVQDSNL